MSAYIFNDFFLFLLPVTFPFALLFFFFLELMHVHHREFRKQIRYKKEIENPVIPSP